MNVMANQFSGAQSGRSGRLTRSSFALLNWAQASQLIIVTSRPLATCGRGRCGRPERGGRQTRPEWVWRANELAGA